MQEKSVIINVHNHHLFYLQGNQAVTVQGVKIRARARVRARAQKS